MAAQKKEISMETRVLIAFALSALILFLYVPLQKRFFSPPPRPVEQPAAKPAPPPAPGKEAAPAPKLAPGKPGRKPVTAPASVKQAGEESETVVENDLYKVVLSNRGAVVKSWVLKNFRDNQNHPLELVNQPAAAVFGYPFLTWTDDNELREKLANALFAVHATANRAPATVTFEYSDGTISARKEFRLEHGGYVTEVSSEVTDSGKPVAHDLAWLGSFGDQTVAMSYSTVSLIAARPDKIERQAYSSIKSESKFDGPFLYGGIEDMFFAAVFMPPNQPPAKSSIPTIRSFRSGFQPPGAQSATTLVGLGVGGQATNNFRVFVGPKSWDVLHAVYPQPNGAELKARGQPVMTLGDLLDYGWFSFIAKPLFLILRWIVAHVVANYGWAIIIITIVINFALFPLKLNSMKSALKMQRLAPQIKAINEKYKGLKLNDPRKQQQNQEVMALYKQHGVNPLGSCLPMLLQMPFLYAFYKVLAISIEMRHAPWVGWIHDLSSKDPYYILPIVMTATMYILQKMTPQTTTDPAQAKMFQFMPLIFGFMFMNFSSGLVLYWLAGNLVGIFQQWYINRTGLAPQPAGRPGKANRQRG